MANQQLALEIVAKDLATATLQKVDAALLDVARRQGSVTAATNAATTSTGDFSRGLGKASNALTNLAGDALGANNKVANLAEGLLTMGVGGGIVTAVSAGIIAITGAVLYFTKETREAKKAYDEYMKSLNVQSPLAIVGRQLDVAAGKLKEMEDAFKALGPTASPYKGLLDQRALVASLAKQYDDLLGGMRATRAEAAKTIADRRAKDAVAAEREALKAMQDELRRTGTGDIGTPRAENTTGTGLSVPGLRLGGDFTAMIPEVKQAGTVFTDFADTLDLIVFRMGAISDATAGIAEGFAALGDVVGGGIGNVAKKVLAPFMKLEGTYFVIKGLAKLAEGLFPPNPALIASGSGMVARGRQLLSMAGGGSVGGGSGSGGGSAAGGASRDVRDAQQRGTVTVTMKEGYASTRDPKFQEFLAETIRNAAGRNITFAVVPG